MAQIDKKYDEILRRILDEGIDKGDRTGTGTRSIFSHTLEYDMKDGFPLITTKKMFTKGIITELLWFLNGSTDLRELVEQGNNIWVGDAYKRFRTDYIERAFKDLKVPTKEEFIETIKTDDEFNNKWGDLGPIYGKQWVKWDGYRKSKETFTHNGRKHHNYESLIKVNQIQEVIDTLKTNPDSRRIMVSAWNPIDIPNMVLPPCHWAFEFYTEELTLSERVSILGDIQTNDAGFYEHSYAKLKCDEMNIPKRRLSLKWHQRSVDTPLGLPFNIASYGFLLEMVAQQVNMVPDKLIGDLTNVHIYQNQLDGVKEQLERDIYRTEYKGNGFFYKYEAPKLKLNKAEDIFSYKFEDFEIENYESYPTIKYPLSN